MNITKELLLKIKEYVLINCEPELLEMVSCEKKVLSKGASRKLKPFQSHRVDKETILHTQGIEDFDPTHIRKKIEKKIDDTWQQSLFDIISEKKLDEVEVYKNACLTKQTFSKIRNDSDYHPDKDTAIRVCLGLKLELDDALDLLSKAGYTLSKSLERDLVIRYFFENEIYDIYEIDIIFEELNIKQFLKY